MKKREALDLKIEGEILTDDEGREYSTYNMKVDDTVVECRLFHTLSNKRLEGETFAEYQVRRHHVKRYKKSRGRMIWFSKNNSTLTNYKISNSLLKSAAEYGSDDEVLKKGLENLKTAEDIAVKTNMGTLDKEKIKKFIEEHEKEQDGDRG